jgi:hypothetical protein
VVTLDGVDHYLGKFNSPESKAEYDRVTDHERLARAARERGLNQAPYARQAVLERLEADERRD